MIQRLPTTLITIAVTVATLGTSSWAQTGSQADQVFDAINAELPGYGTDAFQSDTYNLHDMALGAYLIAAAERGDEGQTRRAADQLLSVRHRAGEAIPGWGLGFRWDAFGDGTLNTAAAVYGITVGITVRGLFDAYDLTGEQAYKDAALEVLAYYKQRSWVAPAEPDGRGFFYYSNQTNDRTARVFNVTSYLMGQYARAYSYTGNQSYKLVADQALEYLWAHRRVSGTKMSWAYQYNGTGSDYSGSNDSTHAAYIVQGLVDYERYLDSDWDITPAVNHLAAYDPSDERLWGIGSIIYTLADAGRITRAQQIRDTILPDYLIEGGSYGYLPTNKAIYPRHTTHLAQGLTHLENVEQ